MTVSQSAGSITRTPVGAPPGAHRNQPIHTTDLDGSPPVGVLCPHPTHDSLTPTARTIGAAPAPRAAVPGHRERC
ncbi:hypothetical protein AWC23_14240 [Mycobacterium saskatchewanense]|uniref:Uncharacterized protein n=1 Tax=Mycobacterium saskatchewanense TaxID=220927 RepID=A0AAJ3NP86_9MYCO|nr:hypothetical protein AWC23_14240 [Mycobacterium saskatchewanense]